MNVYDFTVKTRKGEDVALSDFRGKVLLIVNTATGCGFTPHYEPLEAITLCHVKNSGVIFAHPFIHGGHRVRHVPYKTGENTA